MNARSKPFGSYSAVAKDHVYLLRDGHLYTTPGVVTEVSARFYAVVTLTARRSSFNIEVAGRMQAYQAVAVKPPTQRFISAEDVRLINLNVHPLHPCFRLFQSIAEPGVLALDRDAFTPFDDALDAAYEGLLNIEEASQLHKNIFAIVETFLPKPKMPDPRIRKMLDLLDRDTQCSLEELASAAKLSYKRASLLFSEAVGLPLRSYLLWKKIRRYELMAGAYGSSRSMTEITHAAGFVDSAHLCSTFQESFGAPPSYFYSNKNVCVRSWNRSVNPNSEGDLRPVSREVP